MLKIQLSRTQSENIWKGDSSIRPNSFCEKEYRTTQSLNNNNVLGNLYMQRFAQSCPLSLPNASLCPFGGICHACPARAQSKLKISQPGDKYEQEADRVAEEVMRMPDPSVSEKSHVTSISSTPYIQRHCPECYDELIQRKEISDHSSEMNLNIEPNIHAIRNGGRPLSESIREYFEQRFGYDFSDVRINTDVHAQKTARELHARAFTVGRNIIFGISQRSLDTSEGKWLLAHELTHVVQQKAARYQSQKKNRSLIGHASLPIFVMLYPDEVCIQRQPIINAHPASSSLSDIDHTRNSAQIGVLTGAAISYGLTDHRIYMTAVPDTMPRYRNRNYEVALWSVEIFPNVDNSIYITSEFPDGSCPYSCTLDHEAGHVVDAYTIMLRHSGLLIDDLRSVQPEPNNPTIAANATEANNARELIRARVATLVYCARNQACYDMYRSDYARDVNEYPRLFISCPAPRPPVPRVPLRGGGVVRCHQPPLGCPRAIRLFP